MYTLSASNDTKLLPGRAFSKLRDSHIFLRWNWILTSPYKKLRTNRHCFRWYSECILLAKSLWPWSRRGRICTSLENRQAFLLCQSLRPLLKRAMQPSHLASLFRAVFLGLPLGSLALKQSIAPADYDHTQPKAKLRTQGKWENNWFSGEATHSLRFPYWRMINWRLKIERFIKKL